MSETCAAGTDSRISWEIRVNARVMSAGCNTVRAVTLTSFPASLDGT
jgi:hypothetical protein